VDEGPDRKKRTLGSQGEAVKGPSCSKKVAKKGFALRGEGRHAEKGTGGKNQKKKGKGNFLGGGVCSFSSNLKGKGRKEQRKKTVMRKGPLKLKKGGGKLKGKDAYAQQKPTTGKKDISEGKRGSEKSPKRSFLLGGVLTPPPPFQREERAMAIL